MWDGTLHAFDGEMVYRGQLRNYVSLRWSEEYQGKGAFSLTVADTERNAKILTHGGYLYRTDRKTAMQIVSIVRNEERGIITVSGYTTLNLLARRVILGTYAVNNIESGILGMIQSNLRSLPDIELLPPKGFPQTWEVEYADEEMIPSIVALAKEGELGFRMRLDVERKKHIFEVYQGVDRAFTPEGGGLVFSQEFGSMINLIVTEDDDIFKNVIYVRGMQHEDVPVVIMVGDVWGLERRELIVDGGSQESEESLEDFHRRLHNMGVTELKDRYRVTNFTAGISTEKFGTKYDLGDKVTCNATRYGVRFDTRITAFTQSIENGVIKISITLGEPTITYMKGALVRHG